MAKRSFNSTLVQLKGGRRGHKKGGQRSFNSTLVQLKGRNPVGTGVP